MATRNRPVTTRCANLIVAVALETSIDAGATSRGGLTPPVWLLVPGALAAVGAITLTALPVVKGAVVGLLYALDINRGDARLHTADAAESPRGRPTP